MYRNPNLTDSQHRRDLQRRHARAQRRALKYRGHVHWETVARLFDALNAARAVRS